jgi:hypothetical protein
MISALPDHTTEQLYQGFHFYMPQPPAKKHSTAETKCCQYCGNQYNVKGLGRHEQACGRNMEQQRHYAEYSENMRKTGNNSELLTEYFFGMHDYIVTIVDAIPSSSVIPWRTNRGSGIQ